MEAVAELEPEAIEQTEAVESTAPVEIPAPPPDEAPDYVRQHYDAILAKERDVRVLEGNYLDAKEEAADAKKAFEAADKALRSLIARGPDPQRPLPFGEPVKEPDAWRKAPLSDLGLTDKQLDLFAESGVTTIGGLEDLRASIADRKGEWPKGIGTEKQTEIENKVIEWLTANRDKFGEPAKDETVIGELFVAGQSVGEVTAQEAADIIIGDARRSFGLDNDADVAPHANGKPKPAAKKRAFAGKPAKKAKSKTKRR